MGVQREVENLRGINVSLAVTNFKIHLPSIPHHVVVMDTEAATFVIM